MLCVWECKKGESEETLKDRVQAQGQHRHCSKAYQFCIIDVTKVMEHDKRNLPHNFLSHEFFKVLNKQRKGKDYYLINLKSFFCPLFSL